MKNQYINLDLYQTLLFLCLHKQEILYGHCILRRSVEICRYRQKNNTKMDLFKYQACDEASGSVRVGNFF
jgi:hypothetical protein